MKKTDKLINVLIKYLESSKIFIVEQAPELIKQYISYYKFETALVVYTTFIFFIFFEALTIGCYFYYPSAFPAIGCGICFIITSIVLMVAYCDYKKIRVAPKLTMLDYLKD